MAPDSFGVWVGRVPGMTCSGFSAGGDNDSGVITIGVEVETGSANFDSVFCSVGFVLVSFGGDNDSSSTESFGFGGGSCGSGAVGGGGGFLGGVELIDLSTRSFGAGSSPSSVARGVSGALIVGFTFSSCRNSRSSFGPSP